MRPLVCRTINPILASVTFSAAMIRSPSFSRDGESNTMIKRPFSEEFSVVSMVQRALFGNKLKVGKPRDKSY